MSIIRIESPVESKEEFDKIKEGSQLPDETWTFIEKKQLFSEKVNLFSNKFCIENNIDDGDLFTNFINYLRDREKIEKQQLQELEIRIEARTFFKQIETDMDVSENQIENIALHFYKKGLEQQQKK